MEDFAGQPMPGQVVAGKYCLETELGRGGMSVVYGATHKVTGKRFAIKWLLPEVSMHPEATQRYVRESQVSGRVQHPNLVEIFDIGVEQGAQYIVMEWLEGESLEDKLVREGHFSVEDACRYLLPCMQGLAAAHEAGIVHRDLKPANLFICKPRPNSPELVKVLDFGISMHNYQTEVSARFTKTGTLMGTPHYMSPEQMRGRVVDHRSDIYSFVVILYQLVSGRLPFGADNFGELVVQVSTERAPPLSELVRGLPPGFEMLVARAMARDPYARQPTLDDLMAELAPYAHHRPRRRDLLQPLDDSFAGPAGQRGVPESIAPAVMDRPSRPPGSPLTTRSLVLGGALVMLSALAIGWVWGGRTDGAPVTVELPAPVTPNADAMSAKPAPPPATAPSVTAPTPIRAAAGQPAYSPINTLPPAAAPVTPTLPSTPTAITPVATKPKPKNPARPKPHASATKNLPPPEPAQPTAPIRAPKTEPHNPLQMQLQ